MVRNRRFVLIVIICAALLGLISSEIFLSFAGFGSYPIYDIDNEIKYIPAANQHGRFLNRNAWYFNDRHMGNISNWHQEKHPDFLLIDNSIVLGGNPINHDDKLGPLLEKELGKAPRCGRSPRAVGPMSMRWCISIAIQMSCKTPIRSRPCRSKSVAGILCFSGPQAVAVDELYFSQICAGCFPRVHNQ